MYCHFILCCGPDLNSACFKALCSQSSQNQERQRKYKGHSKMENTFLFEMIIPADEWTDRPLLDFRWFLLI